MNLYQLYDRAAQTVFGPILTERLDAQASRTFLTILKDPRTLPGQHPADFELWLIATQDQHTAEVVAQGPLIVLRGTDLLGQLPQLSLVPEVNNG